jgi:hypothetical protein
MAEATIGALANLATATSTDRGVVATLTEAKSRLAKQLEDHSNKLKEIKALLKKERAERKGQRTVNLLQTIISGLMGTRWQIHKSLSCNYPKHGHKREATKSNTMEGSQANREGCAGVTSLNNREKFEDCRIPPLLEHHDTAIVDSGCTGKFLLIKAPCQNKIKSQNPLRGHLPNGDTMDSTHTSSLDIPELSKAASIAHVFPGMGNHYLLSVGQLRNEGYCVTFRIDVVTIYSSDGKQLLKGKRDLNTSLWRINLRQEEPQCPISVANEIYELRNTGALVNYLHKAMFSQQNLLFCRLSRRGIS